MCVSVCVRDSERETSVILRDNANAAEKDGHGQNSCPERDLSCTDFSS